MSGTTDYNDSNNVDVTGNQENLHFQVDAAILFQLGERLVAKNSIALAELIKNSYDADATRVTVLLEGVTKVGGTIIVEDNGSGMTYDDIVNSWMRIATSHKVDKSVSSRYCRPLTGAKGIGRFASRKLANRLTLSSVAIINPETKEKEKIVVDFDWSSFESGKVLSAIPVTSTL